MLFFLKLTITLLPCFLVVEAYPQGGKVIVAPPRPTDTGLKKIPGTLTHLSMTQAFMFR